jgi:bisphosphoglycerate-independent phosphoglycerate mutase (AlkP superfamily)
MHVAKAIYLPERKKVNTPEMKIYIQQTTDMLGLFYFASKNLESDSVSTIADVIPTILNLLYELETPEVRLSA